MTRKELHEDNRRAWNAATVAHNSHKVDQAAFFRHGGQTLFPEEIALLGDIAGMDVVHLQCNAGQDTLSLARMGARVTGVDISDEAVEFARRLAEESGIPAVFHRADVYDWLLEAGRGSDRYDVAFVSYGALVWLSDLSVWVSRVGAILKPGGRLVVLDFHPFAMILDDDWSLRYPYFASGKPMTWSEGIGDYVGLSEELLTPSGYAEGVKDFKNPHPSHEFQWSLSEIFNALLAAQLKVIEFREYPFINGARLFHGMERGEGKRLYPPPELPPIPLMFGLVAEKQGLCIELKETKMEDDSRKDIRRLLKTFGIKADEELVAHLARNPGVKSIQVRITLEDLTDYGGSVPEPVLSLAIEDEIRR